MDFHTIFRSQCLITDGAMGTYYGEKYGKESGTPETDNLTAPQKIEEIHREYIRAGADILRTNSFASNIRTLCAGNTVSMTREEQLRTVYENVAAACRIAQSAVDKERSCAKEAGRETKEIYIAGDIGPVPEKRGAEEQDAELIEEYKTMAKAHLDAGLKLIWFETFSDFERILPVAEWIRSVSDAFIMVSFSVNVFGYTKT